MAINRNKVLAAARKYVHRGNWEKAIEQYQLLVADDPNDERSLLKIADLYAKLDRRDDALGAYLRVAQHYVRDEFYEKAVAVYVQALRLAPESPDIHRDLGDAYNRLGRLRDAVRAYHKAQKIYRARNQLLRQREVLERMIELDADDIGLRIQLAERYAKDEMRAEAVELFKYCADRLEQEGRVDEFVQVAERIIFLEDQAPKLRQKVIDIYLGRADYRSALSHLQVCFKRRPDDRHVLGLLAQTFLSLGRREKAILVLHELANQQRTAGELDEVAQTYQRILSVDPTDVRARARLERLRQRSDSGVMTTPEHHTGALKARRDTPVPPRQPAQMAVEADPLAEIEFLDEPVEVHAPAASEQISAGTVQSAGERRDQPTAPHPAVRGGSPGNTPFSHNPRAGSSAPPQLPASAELELAGVHDHLNPPTEVAEEVEIIETVAPTVEHEVGSHVDVIARVIEETDVFIKYGLHDKAYETIVGLIAQHPNSLKARAQMARLQQIRQNPAGAADELLEMARITRATPRQSRQFLQKALSMSPRPEQLMAQAREFGLRVDAPGARAAAQDGVIVLDGDDLLLEVDDSADVETSDFELDADEAYDAGHTDRIELSDQMIGYKIDEFGEVQPIGPASGGSDFGADIGSNSAVDGEEPGTQELEFDDVDLLHSGAQEIYILDGARSLDELDEVDDFVELDEADEFNQFEELDDFEDLADLHELADIDGLVDSGAPTQSRDASSPNPNPNSPNPSSNIDVVDAHDLNFGSEPLDEIELLEFEEGGVSEFDFDESAFDDADLVEMDVDLGGFDELGAVELGALGDTQSADGQRPPSFDLSEEEADQFFDELFGDVDNSLGQQGSEPVVHAGRDDSAESDDPDGLLAQVDFFLQQGLVDDAQELLDQVAQTNPTHPGLRRRSEQIGAQRDEELLQVEQNPFGARSLSRKFQPAAEFEASREVGPGIAEAHNTSLELGIAYRDLGLFDEAIMEFTHAMEDPDARHAALFHIALCEVDKGDVSGAVQRLEDLLAQSDTPGPIRQAARQQLGDLQS